MTEENVMSLEKAMESVSESVANFKRFVISLGAFLERHQLGGAAWEDIQNSELDERGYDIAMIQVTNPIGADVMYLYIYTNGTCTGENFSSTKKRDGFGGMGGCTWMEAIEEILRTMGVQNHSALPKEKIDKIIEMLG